MFLFEPEVFIPIVLAVIIGIKVYNFRAGKLSLSNNTLDTDSDYDTQPSLFNGDLRTDSMYSNVIGNNYYLDPIDSDETTSI